MTREANTFWVPALLRLALLCVVPSLIGFYYGWPVGVAVLSVLLAVQIALQLWSVYRIEQWLDHPMAGAAPQVRGVWSQVFARLENIRREDQHSRAEMAEWLARFRQAMSMLPDGVVILDHVMHLEWCNPAAQEHLGLDLSRDEGRLVTNLIRSPDFLDYVILGRFDQPLPLVQRGRKIMVQVIPFESRRQIVVTHDVSQSEQIDTMRRDFIANASHELRTPLTVINGFLEHALSSKMDDATRDAQLKLMAEQGQRMQRLVEDMMTLTRLESLDHPPAHDPVNVDALLAHLVEEARALSGGRHSINLRTERAGLKGNRDELESAFANLLSNAVRYTSEGGHIDVVWELTEEGARLAVKDSGIGIAAEHLGRLTERFYRVDKTRSRATQGTGLGLAIVKRVLLRHHGRLAITSDPGIGSTFSAVFPRTQLVLPDS